MRSCDVISGAVMSGDDKSTAAEAGTGAEVKNKSPAHDTCSTRALFQERPRKFKRHHSVQCRVPGTGDAVKETRNELMNLCARK